MPPREINREQKILDAASRLTLRHGYNKTTVSEIAEEAGISKGAIYLHFKSREDLFARLIEREFDALIDGMLARIDADPNGGTFYGIFSAGLTTILHHPLMKAVFIQDKRILGDYVQQLSPKVMSMARPASKEFIAQLQQYGVVRDDLSPQMVMYIMSLIRYGLLRVDEILPAEDIPPLEEIAETLPDILARSLSGSNSTEEGKRIIRQYIEGMRYIVEQRKTSNE